MLSDIDIKVLDNVIFDSYENDFSSSSNIASSTGVAVTGGALVLDGGVGSYESNGVAYLNEIVPSALEEWEAITIASDIPSGTSAVVQFYTASGTAYTLIPDSDLPGNAAGFTDLVVDLSELDATLYSSVVVGISMSTSNSSRTPEIDEIGVYYRESETLANGRVMEMRGSKIIVLTLPVLQSISMKLLIRRMVMVKSV